MPYIVKVLGTQVSCDTAEEVRELIEKTSSHQNAAPTRSDGERAYAADSELMAVVAMLTKTQRAFLELVAAGEVSDTQACASLQLEGNKQLAGVLAAIHRKFKAAGLRYPLRMEKRFRGGIRSYLYTLSEADARTIKANALKD